jgi:hypothetical protein
MNPAAFFDVTAWNAVCLLSLTCDLSSCETLLIPRD